MMLSFFRTVDAKIIVVQSEGKLDNEVIEKLEWLFADARYIGTDGIKGHFIGPRASMITPWSTNAVEIAQNMGIKGLIRIECFTEVSDSTTDYDRMLTQLYAGISTDVFQIDHSPEPIAYIDNISAYNSKEGLSLNEEEIQYLNQLSQRIGRKLTDSEVFGFSQVNSEHCRHKIFNGVFVLDHEEKELSLFQLIKETSKRNPNEIVSAYKDNVAFIKGPLVEQFSPEHPEKPSYYKSQAFQSILSLKAETHNFPTTVEPFNGAATGSGGEIRDRLAGGKGSIPLAGTAVYMTSYPRLSSDRKWEYLLKERPWLYQTPSDILIKASNGASDFGNKLGQPLICGSLFTFEHEEHNRFLGYDKVIMLAGGIGYGKSEMAQKEVPQPSDKIVILGGDNYRIGMGGAAVSSADTGEFSKGIELNAVQRSNPEMQKRVANTIRALVESDYNPIVSIHDHGAGGHLNCLSELVEETGGIVEIDKLPLGDPTLSAKEIIGNESQERMGLIISPSDELFLRQVAQRERSPMYVVGEVTGDKRFAFISKTGDKPIDLNIGDLFGSSPTTFITDDSVKRTYKSPNTNDRKLWNEICDVLRTESVACKDWLTNKVDRCVGGRVALQQCVGPLQLPLNNCGIMALDYVSVQGVATSVGHSPISGLINAKAGVRNAIAEALTNIIFAPLEKGLKSVSLSANWMWPCRNPGEDVRLYEAVEAASQMAIELGINIPTGKDSLSMSQKYDDKTVIAPGTVIISAAAHCCDFTKAITPLFQCDKGDIYYIDMSRCRYAIGGSVYAQINNAIGSECPDVADLLYFKKVFDLIQKCIKDDLIVAGHDISSGGLITTILEMCFADVNIGAEIDLNQLPAVDLKNLLFSENCGLVIQSADDRFAHSLQSQGIDVICIGKVIQEDTISIRKDGYHEKYSVSELRDIWYETSYLFDKKQTAQDLATKRFNNYKKQPLKFQFPALYNRYLKNIKINKKPIAAILREKGSNSEREMANALYRAGFMVRDVHMTDLVSGRENLEDVRFLGAVGGFSNSDVLGSAKGWAGAFKYNENARKALERFFKRTDTLSVGICNGCQLFIELNLINPEHKRKSKMTYNDSHKHESAFTSVSIGENNSIMLSGLAGSTLGVWISHGEGKFILPQDESTYNIVARYAYNDYPSNPNGSDYNSAMLCSDDGRHLATMPHIERSFYAWNWPYYPKDHDDQLSPWAQAFINAREWIEAH